MSLADSKKSIENSIQKMREQKVRCDTKLEELEKDRKELHKVCNDLDIEPTAKAIQKAIKNAEDQAEAILSEAESLISQ